MISGDNKKTSSQYPIDRKMLNLTGGILYGNGLSEIQIVL